MQPLIKIIIPLFVLSFLIPGKAFSQWNWLNPKPSGYNNNKINFINRTTAFILNDNGDLYRSDDTGYTWNFVRNFPNSICMEIADSTGVIAGWQGLVYISSDNGTTWNQVSSGLPAVFTNISIVSRDTFFLSGNYQHNNPGYVYKTFDRGKNFITLNSGTPIYSLLFLDANIGFVGGDSSIILKTEDGGNTWKEKFKTRSSGITAIQFLDNDTGFALRNGTLLKTYDAGETWNENTMDNPFNLKTMWFVNTQDGYFGGDDGYMSATHDGGNTYESITASYFADGYDINSIYFLSKDTGFAVGNFGRIGKTTDAGTQWTHYATTYSPIMGVSFGSDSTGFAIDGANVFTTTNKGNTWNELQFQVANNSSGKSFKQVYFYKPDSGFIISSNPVEVHRTFNGGINWDTINPTFPYGYDDIFDMQFISAKTGFINLVSSGSSKIMKTKDGGLTWKTVYDGTYFNKIFYIDEETGYASRQEQLYKTTDSSKTWKRVFADAYFTSITGISFSTKQRGVLSTGGGGIITTNDSGKTWESHDFYFMNGVNAMKFINPSVGYLVTGNTFFPTLNGQTYESVDSGSTWQLKNTVGGWFVTFTPDSFVVIAGYGGEILSSKVSEVVLAAKSLTLKGEFISEGVQLSWQTKSEKNNDYFIVERSKDTRNFESVATAKDKENGNILNSYIFIDTNAITINSKKLYYRVKMVDKDGIISYSNIICVNTNSLVQTLIITPNPAITEATIHVGKLMKGGKLFVIDQNGKIALSINLNDQVFDNYKINMSKFLSGTYTIIIENKSGRYVGRVMIMR